jgi:hypothetical protein
VEQAGEAGCAGAWRFVLAVDALLLMAAPGQRCICTLVRLFKFLLIFGPYYDSLREEFEEAFLPDVWFSPTMSRLYSGGSSKPRDDSIGTTLHDSIALAREMGVRLSPCSKHNLHLRKEPL